MQLVLLEDAASLFVDFFAEMFSEVSRHNLRLTGMFTPQQLEIMNRLGIGTYLSSDACIFRTVLAVSGI